MKRIGFALSLAIIAGITPLCIAATNTAQTLPPPATPSNLPPGRGHDEFVKTCNGCHATTLATSQHKSADDWVTIVIDMRARGANGSDDDFAAIVDYLSTNFGPVLASAHVNINTAAADAIASSLALTPQEAEAIVMFRNGKGPFKDVASVEKVPGVDAAKIEAAKDHIDF